MSDDRYKEVGHFLKKALPTVDIGRAELSTASEILASLREKAVEINVIADDILKLEKIDGAEYHKFLQMGDTITKQARRIQNFAWEKMKSG